jgi:hypothetical protein
MGYIQGTVGCSVQVVARAHDIDGVMLRKALDSGWKHPDFGP